MGDQDQQQSQQDHAGTDGAGGGQSGSASASQRATEGQSGAGEAGTATQASQQQTQTPGAQAGGYRLSLTEAQRRKLVEDGVLELSEEQYTRGVRQQIEMLKSRAKAAERRLAEIAAAQEEAERKALEEQERFKDLYEKERAAREKEATARKEDAIRSRFLIAAAKAGIVDPDVAFVVAKSLPGFGSVAIDDEGRVTGVDELVEALVKEKPYLASTQDGKKQSVGAASNPSQQEPPPPKTLAEAGDRLEQALRTGQL
jgi:hypothetical protein